MSGGGGDETLRTASVVEPPSLPGSPPPGVPAAAPLPPRYRDLGLLGRGGNGEVRRVYDEVLDRELAMKLLAPHRAPTPANLARLRAEAVRTAGLQHPGVVPVHDCGALEDGRVWFTMQVVQGETLAAALGSLTARRPSRWTRRGLLSRFVQVAQTLAFAHQRGVVHRDLKPANVMLGAFGEVLVLDWGLSVSLERADGRRVIEGTRRYMAPEQAAGSLRSWEPPVDVYALGRVLGELLGPPSPGPDRRAPLFEAAARATREDPAARGSALDLVEAVSGWLDGERQHEQALAVVAEADALHPRIAERLRRSEALAQEAAARLAALPRGAPLEAREAAWDLEEAAAELALEARQDETVWTQLLRSALNHDPELDEAHERLADHYAERLALAEARRDRSEAEASAWLLAQHDRGRHRAFLDGQGRLTLRTEPPGALATLQRLTPRRRRLVPGPPVALGPTPLLGHPLSPGSYLITLTLPGFERVRYPVLIERQRDWDDGLPLALPRAGAWGPEAALVPGGPARVGGDPAAADALPAQRVWVPPFVARVFPVTHAEYLDHLNDLVARGQGEEAARRQPALGPPGRAQPLYARDAEGRFTLGASPEGLALQPDWPVVAIDWRAARAYAAWFAARDGRPWRLPDELELEKAARGVDGRFFPWGDGFDPHFARVAASVLGPARPASTREHPLDESVYGVRGLAGNARAWCANRWTLSGPVVDGRVVRDAVEPAEGDFMAVRGGVFVGRASSSRAAARYGNQPGQRLDNVGLRLVASAGPEQGC